MARGRKKKHMSKKIKLSEQDVQELQLEFYKHLMAMKMLDGKISFNKTLPSNKDNKRATVEFSGKAFAKMTRLVAEFASEVAWHGTAFRDEQDPTKFYIDDILVYPQKVTGSTVNTDQEKYQTWLYELEDDVFNNIRMQGHSHVNFSTSPSGVDLAHQEQIISQLEEDMFYIFMIWNKRLDRTIMIYDYANNIFYENADIDVPGMEMSFVTEAKKAVETSYYSGAGSWQSGYKNDTGSKKSTAYDPLADSKKKDDKPTVTPSATDTKKTIEVVSGNAPVKTDDKKSGDGMKTKPKTPVMGAGWRGATAYDDEDDDTCFGGLLERFARS